MMVAVLLIVLMTAVTAGITFVAMESGSERALDVVRRQRRLSHPGGRELPAAKYKGRRLAMATGAPGLRGR